MRTWLRIFASFVIILTTTIVNMKILNGDGDDGDDDDNSNNIS